MTDWTARAHAILAERGGTPTTKTIETGYLTVSVVPTPRRSLETEPGFDGFVGTPPGSFERCEGEQRRAHGGLVRATTWFVIQGSICRPVTIVPAATAAEVEELHPGMVIALRANPAPDRTPAEVATAAALWALLDERDESVISRFAADPDALDWLRSRALSALRRNPDQIASLTASEVIEVAMALAGAPGLAPTVIRQIETLVPAIRGRQGSEERKAVHARRILRLIALQYPGPDFTGAGQTKE